jgi:3-hydroxyisobutyrate dehydrogenase-like beta-hydroxyacid dehydrogenase
LPKGDVTVEKVGFVGAAMAGNLLRTGNELVVHNRIKTKSALQNPSTASG